MVKKKKALNLFVSPREVETLRKAKSIFRREGYDVKLVPRKRK